MIIADRDMVESASDDILENAQNVDVAFLVVGDPFGFVLYYSFHNSAITPCMHSYIAFSIPNKIALMFWSICADTNLELQLTPISFSALVP